MKQLLQLTSPAELPRYKQFAEQNTTVNQWSYTRIGYVYILSASGEHDGMELEECMQRFCNVGVSAANGK